MLNNPENNPIPNEYSRQLSEETRAVLNKIIPYKEEYKDDLESSSENLNRSFLRACTIFILSELTDEERKSLQTQEINLKTIIQLAIDKVPMKEDVRAAIETQIQKITDEDLNSQTDICNKLDLDNSHSLPAQLHEHLLDSFSKKPEVNKAYARLII